jgi:tetratricopeptide (TPR) repeat protein
MFGFAWLTIRQARDALKHGRLEEAQRLLSQPAAQGQRGAADLLAQLARGHVERGERQLRLDDAEGAWRDLVRAEQLGTGEKSSDRLRQALVRLGIAEVRALLQAGEVRRADEAIARLRERNVRSPELQVLEEGARDWLKGQDLADRGEFAQAIEAIERVRRLFPGSLRFLDQFHNEVEQRRQAFATLVARLHEAADAARWGEVVEVAEQVLMAAPQHAEARKARARAWKAVQPATIALAPPQPQTNGEAVACEGLPPRFLLWIDGVGGYLVCLGPRVTFGQALLDGRVDVPLVADVSRFHATLSRDAEGYLLEAVRPIQVNGHDATRALLQPGDRVTLGTSCQFQFRLPVPVSTTARLDLVSGHRLPLTVDGILLMADTLVLGSGPQAHVTVPDLKEPIVLFRHKDALGIRHKGKLLVNGLMSGERSLLGAHATVSTEDISFAIEPVVTRMVHA